MRVTEAALDSPLSWSANRESCALVQMWMWRARLGGGM